MDFLAIQGVFGEESKWIRVSAPKAGGSWEIFVDSYRQGSITFYKDQYVVHMNDRSLLNGDDLWILLDMLQASQAYWQTSYKL